jgi:hypothetical protein
VIITKKAIPRRTMLRGLGATLALPLLDSMVPALSALSKTAGAPVKRFGIVYVPNGMVMKNWTPATEGTGFELTRILQPLAPFRDQLIVATGLHNKGIDQIHDSGAPAFLTGTPPRRTQGSDLHAGVSMDQIVAREYGRSTQLASLEIACESGEDAGTCGAGYTCAYVNTICWRDATTPLPMETNPRAVFERLLGDGVTDSAARAARLRSDRSILDAVTDKIARLQRGLGARDRSKLTQYLEAVRDIERRIQLAETQSAEPLPDFAQPAGVPASFDEHVKLMFDLQLLAYQADLTRVITFMVAREYSGRTYPEIGVPDAHHSISHHRNDADNLEKLTKIGTYHTSLFAYYLEKLKATPDGDGSLLDHMTILYGTALSDSNTHSTENLPVLLVGGGAGQLKGGRHIKYPETTPMANMHVTLMDKLGVPVEHFGESFLAATGQVEGLSTI